MNAQQARIEAERCLQCFDAPCTQACPAQIRIPTFISMIRSGNVRGAAEVVRSANALASTCGKICPQEVFCQAVCTRAQLDSAIDIRGLHFFATQFEVRGGYSTTRSFPASGKKVAVIGAGPAGLACAFELAKFGHRVDVYERGRPGGVPRNSIPAFRLSDGELDADTLFLTRYLNVKRRMIDAVAFRRIRKSHNAVFLAVGLGKDRRLGIPGEKLKGILPVLKFLETARRSPARVNIGKTVIVIGGGNVSLDAAATARRLGATRVTLIYRRSEKEMRVWKSELEEARRVGVEIRFLTNPVELVGSGRVRGIRCRQTRLSRKKDASGRPIPAEIPGTETVLAADTVILAIGQTMQADWLKDVRRTGSGYVAVNRRFQTSLSGVFAGGDMIAGEGTIVQSVAHGKHAAHAIHAFLARH